MTIQKDLLKTTLAVKTNMKNTRVAKLNSFIFSAAFIFTASQSVHAEVNQCSLNSTEAASSLVAGWDFNAGDLPSTQTGMVTWHGDRGGLQSVPNTSLQGIKFGFKGTDINKDSTNEWRYTITSPMSSTWEHLKIYQPENFYHRAGLRILSPVAIDPTQWRVGDKIVNIKGVKATIAKVDGNYLYVTDYDAMFSKNWGAGKEVFNLTTNAEFVSEGYRFLGNNNKFSTQWHGRYSNAGMTMETHSLTPEKGYENGVSYCRPTLNTSEAHRGTGGQSNNLGNPAECFHPRDNGTVVEFVIERVRSTTLTSEDGSYRIWKKTASSDWTKIYENAALTAYNPDNYFTNGYVFGWSNSGYNEDTDFYLLGWNLYSQKPSFVK
ncbi:hypothetical protein [Alteromonas sp. ASW11-130]|uniref:hypothetical protein n=1 Tax=Alteromonas sp. ASW11-130 TaxID=3015775 RepID=UPI0022424668|nr:hypothetical protein [Alteromonas sp. ASW11-130]MCW8091287.1 hypothetical protein [Alteromonas sp. ASW11-130]